MELRDDRAWLLRSRFNPHPIAGTLAIADGEITFRIDDDEIAEDSLEWLDERLGIAVRDRLEREGSVVAFSYPLEDCEVSWPITGGGGTMVVVSAERRWVVSCEERSGGSIAGTLAMVWGRRRARDWKRALAETQSA